MSVVCHCAACVMDLSGVFCVADSGVLQDAFLWNSMGTHTCSVWFSNTLMQRSQLAANAELMLIAMWFHVIIGRVEQSHVNFNSKNKSNSNSNVVPCGWCRGAVPCPGNVGSVRWSEVSHISFWRQIGGTGPVGSASPLVLVLPVVVVIWNGVQEVGIFVLHWMWEVGKGDWTCHHSCNSVQRLLLLLWHSGPEIIPDWMGQIRNRKSAVWAGLPLDGHCGVVCSPSHKDLQPWLALWSHATPGHGHWFHHLFWRGDLCQDSNPGELCCSSALMAGMFGCSDQNNCRFCRTHRLQCRWRAAVQS